MKSPSKLIVLTAILLATIMVVPAFPGSASQDVDHTKIDNILWQEILARNPSDDVEIIVQFREEVREEDINHLRHLEIEPHIIYHAIPAVYAKGPVEGVLALSAYARTYWIEYNQENDLLLQETTTVIRANQVWTSEVKEGDLRDFEFNTQSQLSGLDGTGVTVAIVDTGVDGQHPDLDYGEKLIMNKHKNGPNDPWVEMENSDTSYGHGTHCAGIVAGNGDASGGMRRGVAPGANLIGVGGDWTPIYWAVLEGLEWVYDNSRPDNNPNNIRVVSNSWGGDGDYDPQDAITRIANKLTYENNVVCVFAAGNSGEGNHDGATDSTGQQSKIPSVISVAATTHNGKGLAIFTSRGKKGDFITYPDVAAPGVNIWATRPRYTWLGEYQLVDQDMYYMAISGTSMATPHVSGLTAILFQAAPSLRVSEHHEDDNAETGSWGEDHDPRIHEAEYILKMTSELVPYKDSNGVPGEKDQGLNEKEFDYAQGYGMVNADKAVAVALTLEKLRQGDQDATVDDALKAVGDYLTGDYGKILDTTQVSKRTDTLTTSWRGEWAQLTNGSNPLSTTSFSTDQHHRVFIPEESVFLSFDLSYNPLDVNSATGGRIDVTLDYDGDGDNDVMPQAWDVDGNKHYELDLTDELFQNLKGSYWTFNVEGDGIKATFTNQDDEFHEALIEYTIGLTLILDESTEVTLDETDYLVDSSPWCFGNPSPSYDDTEITLQRNVFILSEKDSDDSFIEENSQSIMTGIILLIVALAGCYVLLSRRMREGYV